MASLGDLKRLLTADGWDRLDAAAALVGKEPPSAVAKPIRTMKPEDLVQAISDWKKISGYLDDHIEDFKSAVPAVRAVWNAPDTFYSYTGSIVTALENQSAAIKAVGDVLELIRGAMKTEKDKVEEAGRDWAMQIVGIIVTATIAGAAAGLLTLGGGAAGAVAAGIAALTALILSAINWLYQRSKAFDGFADAQEEQMKTLETMVGDDAVKEIAALPMPDISNVQSFKLLVG